MSCSGLHKTRWHTGFDHQGETKHCEKGIHDLIFRKLSETILDLKKGRKVVVWGVGGVIVHFLCVTPDY